MKDLWISHTMRFIFSCCCYDFALLMLCVSQWSPFFVVVLPSNYFLFYMYMFACSFLIVSLCAWLYWDSRSFGFWSSPPKHLELPFFLCDIQFFMNPLKFLALVNTLCKQRIFQFLVQTNKAFSLGHKSDFSFFFLRETKGKKSLWVKRNIFLFIADDCKKNKVLEMKSFIG